MGVSKNVVGSAIESSPQAPIEHLPTAILMKELWWKNYTIFDYSCL